MTKKTVFSLIVLATLLQAQKLPYKIFVETYSQANTPAIQAKRQQVENALEKFQEAKVIARSSDDYQVVVVETVMEPERANELLSTIRALPGHKDAFMKPAPELLQATQIYSQPNEPATEEVVVIEEESITTVAQPIETNKEESEKNSATILTLESTIDSLLQTNPNIQERIFNYLETGKDLDIADKGYYPTLDLTGSVTLGKDRASIGSKNGEDDKWHKNFNKQAELRLVENIYNGGSTASLIEQSKNRMENASYLVLERADRTTLQTISAYLDVLKEKELLDLANENVQTHEEIYDQIEERASSGFGRTSEQQQAGSRLTLARSNFIAQQNAYNDALAIFKKLTGKSVVGDELQYPKFTFTLPESLKDIEAKALECNPSIRAEIANIKLAKNLYKDSNAAFLPKIDLEAYASVKDTENYSYDSQRIDSYGALLRLRYNLFNKGIDKTTKEKRQIVIQKEQQILDTIKRDLKESVRFSWQSYTLTKKKLDFLEDHANFSKDTLDSYKEEFKIGRRDLINVLDAENEYYSAQKEILAAKKDFMYSKYRLLDNMGLLTDSFKTDFGKQYIKSACSIQDYL